MSAHLFSDDLRDDNSPGVCFAFTGVSSIGEADSRNRIFLFPSFLELLTDLSRVAFTDSLFFSVAGVMVCSVSNAGVRVCAVPCADGMVCVVPCAGVRVCAVPRADVSVMGVP